VKEGDGALMHRMRHTAIMNIGTLEQAVN